MLIRFLQTLHDSGRAEIAQPGKDLIGSLRQAGKEPGEERKLLRMLESWHAEAVMDLPGPALAFHPEAAVWAAHLLFRAAFLTCFREIGVKDIRALLCSPSMPDPAEPAAHFSADLCLRHWPDLHRMARARSEDDPLVAVMHGLATEFPLSCVGMGVEVAADSPVLRHGGLRQYFTERALERADHACLALPGIASLARSKLGAYASTLGRGLIPSPIES